MASEIRVNTINNRSGLGTISINDSGASFSGVVTATSGFSGDLTGNVTGNVTGDATGLSGSPTLSGITSVSTTNLTVNGNAYPTAGSLSNRNLIINGAMQVAQRGTSFNLAHDGTTAAWTLDRFRVAMSGADQWDCTVTQSSEAPDGYANSLLITTGTAETTVDAAEYASLQYKVEAQDLQQIASGTSAAKDMRLSFWVRSSQTGTFAFGIYKAPQTQRGLSATYTINSADTWEQKTLSIPGDTAGGGIDDNNGLGMNFYWLLAAGSDWTSTDSTSWINYVTTGLAYGHAQNGVVTTASATWQITGVQLEVGQVATPFEHRSYGDELARCQRYYYKIQAKASAQSGFFGSSFNRNTTTCLGVTFFPVELRSSPTALEQSGTASDYQILHGTTQTVCTSVPAWWESDTFSARTLFTTGASLTAGQGSILRSATTNAFLAWSAEL